MVLSLVHNFPVLYLGAHGQSIEQERSVPELRNILQFNELVGLNRTFEHHFHQRAGHIEQLQAHLGVFAGRKAEV